MDKNIKLQENLKMENYETLRERALNRTRRIIYDNDGCDIEYNCRIATEKELLSKCMYQLLGTKVDTVFCATMSSGFGQFTHATKIGSVFTSKEDQYQYNMTGEFIIQGTDYLSIVSELCRENGIEIFWQMRMNDTHDASTAWYGDIIFMENRLNRTLLLRCWYVVLFVFRSVNRQFKMEK